MNDLNAAIGHTDIYLIDQIMKGRYGLQDKILDAGCGYGRNMHWFLRQGVPIFGADQDAAAIGDLADRYPDPGGLRFRVAPLQKLPYEADAFDHVICSAVLHFAASTELFYEMVAELVRVLRPGGSLFIRMAADIGIEAQVRPVGNGVYEIPDGSRRFLLTRVLLAGMMERYPLSFLEPLKTTNVSDIRCMSTLVLGRPYR